MEFTNQQKEAIQSERQGEVVHLCCEDHAFFPGKVTSMPMVLGCKYCILAQLYYDFAKTPPHMRLERLDQLESALHHFVESVERGNPEHITIFDRPHVTIEKDVDV